MTTITTEEIKQMLERFYNAETTDEEEATLKAYFRAGDVPTDLQTDKALFDHLDAPEIVASHDFGLRLSRNIDRWNMLEKTTVRRARTLNMRRIAGVAAAMLLLFGLATYLTRQQTPTNTYTADTEETYDNPNDAAGQTERALTKFSLAINKGLNKINNTETR